jgi:transcriptional regulator with GAF, ATPase, and Fis domain
MKRGLFEIAKGGTLFLDEIGEMDVKLQAKLLRVLQEKRFRRVGGTVDMETDVRVVAATNRDLGARVSGGGFREDLYHRLNRVVVELPALRERAEDIVPMAKQFTERAFQARGKTFGGFTPESEEALRQYGWPGNVRELLNVVERAALVYQGGGTVSPRDLALPGGGSARPASNGHAGKIEMVSTSPLGADALGGGGYMDLKKKWGDAFEREYLIGALARHAGNVSAAAREAKIDRSNFLRLLRRHGLKAQDYRKVGAPGVEVGGGKVAA